MAKTYDLQDRSLGFEPNPKMWESLDHKGQPDSEGDWVKAADYMALEALVTVLTAEREEASRMMLAIKRTWGPESHDDGADGELWAWLNAFVARHSQSDRSAE